MENIKQETTGVKHIKKEEIKEEERLTVYDMDYHLSCIHELKISMPKLPEIAGKKDIPILEDMINIQEKLAKKESYDYATNDKMYQSDPEYRHLCRLEKLKEFLLTDQKIKLDYANTPGLILINNKYIASLSSGKWRVKGKNKWYWYKTPQQLVDKYILR